MKAPAWSLSVILLGSIFAVQAQESDDYLQDYDRCLTGQGGLRNATVEVCANQVSAAIEVEMESLGERIEQMIEERDPDDIQRFRDSQQQWQSYRNNHCLLAGSYIGSPMYAYCPMEMNIDRLAQLRLLAAQYSAY